MKSEVAMRVTKKPDGQLVFAFALTGKEVYELLCSQIGWTLLQTTGKTKEEVEKMTIEMVHDSNDKEMVELEKIRNPFIRAVLTEKKRLNLNDLYTKE